MIRWALPLLMLTALVGCKSTEPTVQLPETYTISVGRGGGFTGMYTYYTFDQTGKVTTADELNKVGKEAKTVDKAVVKEQMTAAVTNKYTEVKMDQPGNFTNFLQFKSPKGTVLYKWHEGVTVPEWITKMHGKLWGLAE